MTTPRLRKDDSPLAERPMLEPPRIWLLMGHRAGDNAQLLALVEALGWPYEIKRLAYKRFELLPKELDTEEGELTATQKVKRAAIADEFARLIEGMYA